VPPPSLRPDPRALTAVFVDHLRVAFREPAEFVERALLELIADHWADLEAPFDGDDVEIVRTDKAGNFGEQRAWTCRGLPLCRVLVAGKSTRGVGHFIIDGASCRLVRPEFWRAIAEVGAVRRWVVKRLDAAVDDDSGQLSVDVLEAAYDARLLSPVGAGAPRLLDVRDPRRGTAATGWTVYVGTRKAGFAFLRIYAKHAEVVARLGEAGARSIPECRVRCEVEWKEVKHGPGLSWSMVAEPAPFFAADCPVLEWRAGGVDPVRVGRVVRDQAESEMLLLLQHARNSYGAVIDQAFWSYGGDDLAARVVLDLLRRPGVRVPVAGVAEVAGGGKPDKDYIHQ